MSVAVEKIAVAQAPLVARGLLEAAKRGGTEADFRREASRILEQAGSTAQLTIVPRDEFSVARGRVDSVYNRLVLECKRPGVIRGASEGRANQEVIQQVKDYILDVARRERREAQRLAGVATDGSYYIFVRRVGEGWSVDAPLPVNVATTERFLRLLFSLSHGIALIPENLVEYFGPQTELARRSVQALYAAFCASEHPLVLKLFEQWRFFFSEATDYQEWAARIESKPEFRAFVKSLWTTREIAELDAAKVFFVLHTYYALLVKLIASLAAAKFAGEGSAPLDRMAGKEGENLRREFVNLERGGLFREYGLRNFLEGDFFGWYLTAWNADIEATVSGLVQRLADFDAGTLELAPENARDLLKKLYHYLLPREIRHDLGEYYTPDWLAERLIRQTLGLGRARNPSLDPRTRVLDPACGSGTFLVILIKFIRERVAEGRIKPAEALEATLRNIIGFDLNPLAVIAARTNYLLALGDLLKARKGDIDLPVYQTDSILIPSRGANLYEHDVFPLKTAVGEFRVPGVFAERERMDALANILDESVEAGVGEEVFLERLKREVNLPAARMKAAADELKGLYQQLRELHQQGLNGVWARIIKNTFAPLFLEPCDYIVGNPPWVNWEHLPDGYRADTGPLWDHYGLSPRGKEAAGPRLGAVKVDISALMTCVAVDRYLRRGGKLGFVLSQSLFKTSGAGQGFRRFLLPDKTPWGPLVVEDMVELKPFEGATNRTVVAIFGKGKPVRYPVSYPYWKKRGAGRGSAIAFDMPYEEVTTEKITSRSWYAEPVDREDRTSAWLTARRQALQALRHVLRPSAYQAHAGCCGWLNAVYWVEIIGWRPDGGAVIANITRGAKKTAPAIQVAVEPDLLFPLLRGRDVRRWRAAPAAHILLPHDPKKPTRGYPAKEMKARLPKTYGYLVRFEKELRARSGYRLLFEKKGEPFWTIADVGPYTFAPWKVVWREQAATFTAAVIGPQNKRIIVPDHKLMMVAAHSRAEAHYLCAALNSAPACLAITAYAIQIQMDTHILENVAVPKFAKSNRIHARLAQLSAAAHRAAAKGNAAEVKRLEAEVDQAAARLWRLSADELAEIKRSLEEA